MSLPFRLTAAATIVGTTILGAMACAKSDHATTDSTSTTTSTTTSTSTTTTSSSSPNTVTITAKEYAFDAPSQVPAGVTTIHLVNQGQQLHHVQILKFEQGKTLADFQAAMKAGGPFPAWAVMVGGPNAPAPHGGESNATLNLAPGQYAFACFVDIPDHMPHIMKGMVQPFTVTPATGAPAAEPTADVSVTLSDYNFALSKPLTAGSHTIRVENTADQPHEIELVQLDSGKTADDVLKWIADPKGPPPGRPLGGIAGLSKGTHGYFTADLVKGNYALLCFLPDMKDGKPHFMHGMKQEFTI